jgi:1,4-dihydroxy-2-naphthoyl-CoA synthase
MMRRIVSSAFLFAWVMWLNADGRWSAGQLYENKGECDLHISATRERVMSGYTNVDWTASAGGMGNSIQLRNISTGQRKNIFLVCYPYPSVFSPK